MASFRCLRCKAELQDSYRACPQCGESVTEFTRRYTSELLDGKYEILERLGAGGMGQVFKATHALLGSTRVIKVILPQISESQDAHDRFLREARAATKVQHSNVASVHDFAALPNGAHYMVTEYIDGENLAQRLRTRGTLPPKQALRIAIQALQGLEAIHRAGIVHRDISPENLMITKDDVVKIIDLGVAKVEDPTETAATRTGIFVGKLRYAAPEQLGFLPEGEKVDGRVDLYAMGMVLYEMLTGRPPYEAKSPHEYFLLHASAPKPINDLPAGIPAHKSLQNVLFRALARDRNARFANAHEFIESLETIERTLPNETDTKTLMTALDDDETFRPGQKTVDTLHRETLRTNPPAAEPTLRTPIPAAIPPPGAAAATTPSMSMPVPPAPQSIGAPVPVARKSRGPLIAILLILFVFAGGAVALVVVGGKFVTGFLSRAKDSVVATATTATTTTTTNAAMTQQPSATSLDVVPTTSSAEPALIDTVATATTGTTAPTVLSAPVLVPKKNPLPTPVQPTPKPQPPPPAQVAEDDSEPAPSGGAAMEDPAHWDSDSVPIYRDGGGDSNDEAIEVLREQMGGVSSVAVDAGEMRQEVIGALRGAVPSLQIIAYGPVVVHFEGRMETLGKGRKRRAARATITKNGRVIFRYELPDEVYRVGLTPARAFARVLGEAF